RGAPTAALWRSLYPALPVLVPRHRGTPPRVPARKTPWERHASIIRDARQALARRYAQRSRWSTSVYLWCDLYPTAAGMGDPYRWTPPRVPARKTPWERHASIIRDARQALARRYAQRSPWSTS